MATAETEAPELLEQGDSVDDDGSGVEDDYPLKVDYCGLCTMPPEVINYILK